MTDKENRWLLQLTSNLLNQRTRTFLILHKTNKLASLKHIGFIRAKLIQVLVADFKQIGSNVVAATCFLTCHAKVYRAFHVPGAFIPVA